MFVEGPGIQRGCVMRRNFLEENTHVFCKNQIVSLEPHDSYEIAVLSLKKFLAVS